MNNELQLLETEWGCFSIQMEAINTQKLIMYVGSPEMGAINIFVGTVREWTKGKRTLHLEYEAYIPMALRKLQQIGEEIREQWPGARVAISHRIGALQIGEAAVVIAVATPHRDAAYQGSRYAIERIKEIVPIWKKEIWEDGASWIGNQKETISYPEGRPMVGDQ